MNLQELIKEFKDGENRYTKSPMFKTVLDHLQEGTDSLKVIDNLLSIIETHESALMDYRNEK